jgi:tRNA threonylcarbamoyladenosine biosynthesis protein TsaB
MTASADQQTFACLAIESATGVGSIAACAGARTSQREYAGHPMQSRDIYAGVRDVLDEVGLDLAALDCIALGCGPGAFTGLRVSAAVTQALAYGAGKPVVRVSSLVALAVGAARKHRADCIAPCFDARMGEAYLALYNGGRSGEWHDTVPDCLVDPQRFRLPSELSFFAAGPGWSACPELVDNHAAQMIGSDFALVPSAADILALAAGLFRDGRTVSAAEALPNYIRDQVTG